MVVLHPVIGVGAVHEAGNAGRVVGVGGQTEDVEALAGHLGAGIFVAIAGLGRPFFVVSIGVVAGDLHYAALGHGLLVQHDFHGSHHGLARIAEAARRTVIEHVPLAVDFLQRAVGVVTGVGGDELRAVLVVHHAARVDQHATRAPRAEGRVAEGIAQGRVGGSEAVLLTAVAAEHHDIFVAHLADARCLEEVEVERVLTLVEGLILRALLVEQLAVAATGGDEGVDELGAGALAVHRVLVELAGGRVLEAVEHVGAEALVEVGVLLVGDVLDEHRGVEVDERAGQALGAVLGEVHGSEGAVGAVALTHHGDAAPAARVGIEPVGLLARLAVGGTHEVGGEHGVPLSVDEPREDRAFVAPLGEILDGCRPHADVGAAVGGVGHVVRADDVGTQLAGLVGVFKHAGLAVGQMLPQGQVGVLGAGHKGDERQKRSTQ